MAQHSIKITFSHNPNDEGYEYGLSRARLIRLIDDALKVEPKLLGDKFEVSFSRDGENRKFSYCVSNSCLENVNQLGNAFSRSCRYSQAYYKIANQLPKLKVTKEAN